MITTPKKTSHKLAAHWTMSGCTIKLDANEPEGYFNLQPVSHAGSIFVLRVVPIGAPALSLIQRSVQQPRQIHGTNYFSYEPDSDWILQITDHIWDQRASILTEPRQAYGTHCAKIVEVSGQQKEGRPGNSLATNAIFYSHFLQLAYDADPSYVFRDDCVRRICIIAQLRQMPDALQHNLTAKWTYFKPKNLHFQNRPQVCLKDSSNRRYTQCRRTRLKYRQP
jgi:hypothetical protein